MLEGVGKELFQIAMIYCDDWKISVLPMNYRDLLLTWILCKHDFAIRFRNSMGMDIRQDVRISGGSNGGCGVGFVWVFALPEIEELRGWYSSVTIMTFYFEAVTWNMRENLSNTEGYQQLWLVLSQSSWFAITESHEQFRGQHLPPVQSQGMMGSHIL